MVNLFYITYISKDLAHREIFSAKVGKGGINMRRHCKTLDYKDIQILTKIQIMTLFILNYGILQAFENTNLSDKFTK